MSDAAPTALAKTRGRVVTAETLVVGPAVLGLPLAEPRQRLLAMAIDLGLVAALSLLSKPVLGLATGAMLLVLFGNAAAVPIALKLVRTGTRVIGAMLALASLLALGHGSFARAPRLQLDKLIGSGPSAAMKEDVYIAPDASAAQVRADAQRLQKQVEALKDEIHELHEAGTSWLFRARTLTGALGVTFGWSGVYFTLLAGLWNGRTPGKFLAGTRAVKVNGARFTFFDAFVRHGGYVAGVAMGLTGFLKLLWEPNRQAVEDRIASTVVVNVRLPTAQ